MMAATPTKLSSEADVGRSKAQHVVILAFCSKIAGITYSASPNTALDPRLGAKTGLNDEVFVNKLTASVPNGKCQIKSRQSLQKTDYRNRFLILSSTQGISRQATKWHLSGIWLGIVQSIFL